MNQVSRCLANLDPLHRSLDRQIILIALRFVIGVGEYRLPEGGVVDRLE